ncbi:MAG: hypothetical protein QOC94_1335 [Actinoplanes sp.]|jgi:hypothetical protein|nr:hypothetical protein [Actinoplanes sp.]
MTSDLEVDADAARDCAAELAGTAAAVAGGSTAPPPAPGPHWQATGALESLAAATERELRTLADDLDEFRRAVLAALADYEAADDRAAARLGGIR